MENYSLAKVRIIALQTIRNYIIFRQQICQKQNKIENSLNSN